ncbi:hypothetical protein I8J29_05795 [Paenibacillus sp. MWE-103]|uniref:Uncharacterized protein n=1 Tax=Paenibacillus artemisiicola TaxID=1172618 RepID=A0ABS3W5W0_9BACL|nr:hypothetical protein [Paenibacillus artemisiicola]MBO7743700.1 hypothetical protein [Paenibacillus artemisiicola]
MSAILHAHTYRLQYREGEGILLEDRSSGQRWLWPEATLGAVNVTPVTVPAASFFVNHHCGKDQVELAAQEEWAVQSVLTDQQALHVELAGPGGRIVQVWELDAIGLRVRTDVIAWDYGNAETRLVSPGIVRAASGESPAVVPIYQGIVHHKGEYAALIAPGSHGRY